VDSYFQVLTTIFVPIVVEALEPCRKSLERLSLDFGWQVEDVGGSFRFLPSMKAFTALRTLHLHQRVVGLPPCSFLFWTASKHVFDEDAFTKILPRSIETLHITRFHDAYGRAVFRVAKQAAAGAYPQLKYVRLIRAPYKASGADEPDHPDHPGSMAGRRFLAFARGQEAPRLAMDSSDSGKHLLNIDPSQVLPGDEENADDDDGVSGDSASGYGGYDFFPRRPTDRDHKREWVEFCRHCLHDRDFKTTIMRSVSYAPFHPTISLNSALKHFPLRNRIRMLFSEANVRFECVEVGVFLRCRASDASSGYDRRTLELLHIPRLYF
jgi:hypothetical protein